MNLKKQRFKKGDYITDGSITRKITKVLNIGYKWIYPGFQNEEFNSNNSNDVNLDWWTLKL